MQSHRKGYNIIKCPYFPGFGRDTKSGTSKVCSPRRMVMISLFLGRLVDQRCHKLEIAFLLGEAYQQLLAMGYKNGECH